MGLNQVLHLQTEIAHAYMRNHGITPREFAELDNKYDILRFIQTGYEPFHVTGTQGVLNEVESYIAAQDKSSGAVTYERA